MKAAAQQVMKARGKAAKTPRHSKTPRSATALLIGASVAGLQTVEAYADELIETVRSTGPMEAKEWAAEALHALAEAGTSHAHSIARRGLRPLLALCDYGSHEAMTHAAGAVALIIEADPSCVDRAAKLGAVESLTRALRCGQGPLLQQAAAALGSMAALPEHTRLLLEAGAVPLLVGLLRTSNMGNAAPAARALGKIAASRDGHKLIVSCGAIPPLLGMLDIAVGQGAQECAARALAQVARESLPAQREIRTHGGVAILVATLSAISHDVQTAAAAVLSELCQGVGGKHRRRAQDAVVKAGGVGPLLAAIDTPLARQPLVAQATHAIAMLARHNRPNQDLIAEHGGLRPLVEQLQPVRPDGESNTQQSQASAALALMWLCHQHTANQTAAVELGAISQLCVLLRCNSEGGGVEAEAAGALWALADGHAENQVSIASAGAIPTLCELLAHPNERAQRQAAKALAAIAKGAPSNQRDVASLLVATLARRGLSVAFQKRVLHTLWQLVSDNADNQAGIAAAGGAEPLVYLLRRGANGSREYALWSLSLALDESSCGVLVSEHGVESLVALLASPEGLAIEQAAAALAKLAAGSDQARRAIAAAGGIAPLVALLDGAEAHGSVRAQRDAAAALAELAVVREHKVSIESAGGIVPLVALLCSYAQVWPETPPTEAAMLRGITNTSKRFAAAALSRISDESRTGQMDHQPHGTKRAAPPPGTAPPPPLGASSRAAGVGPSKAEQIADAGAVPPLVSMLSGEAGVEAQGEAAGALWSLADSESNRLAITESGAIGPLVALLACDNQSSRDRAEAALVRLSIETSNRVLIIRQLVGMLLVDPAPYASAAEKKAAHATQRDDAARARAILEEAKAAVADAQASLDEAEAKAEAKSSSEVRAAELILQRAVAECDKRAAADLTLRALVEELDRQAADEQKAQEQAAAALVNLARDSEDNRISICSAGGVPALLGLLTGDSASAKESTLGALIQLASMSPARQEAIATAGGVGLLADLLQAGASKSDAQTATQNSLAAEAVWKLCKRHAANKRAFAEAGAIAPLVIMLGSPQPEICTNAAGALSCLARGDASNQNAIARTGAIAPLCTLLREGAEKTREQSASAIWALATGNAANKSTIAKFGAVEPLVALVVNSATPKAWSNSIGALASLSSQHAENRTAVAKRVAGLTSTKDPDRAVKALGAIASLCSSSESGIAGNQIAVTKAGAVDGVVGWLESSSVAAQTEAAHALLAICKDNVTTQALVVASGAIQPLIRIVASCSAPRGQEHAARALWQLASCKDNQVAIAEAGGIAPLVSMLTRADSHAAELAAVVLHRLARGNEDVAEAITALQGIRPLCMLLSAGTAHARQQATSVLAELARLAPNRDRIANCGAIAGLVALLTSVEKGTAEVAATALGYLAREDGTLDGTLETQQAGKEVRNLSKSAAARSDSASGRSDRMNPPAPAAAVEGTQPIRPEGMHHEGRDAADGSDEAGSSDDEGEGFCGAASRRAFICQQGGIPRLLSMLGPTEAATVQRISGREVEDAVGGSFGGGNVAGAADHPRGDSNDVSAGGGAGSSGDAGELANTAEATLPVPGSQGLAAFSAQGARDQPSAAALDRGEAASAALVDLCRDDEVVRDAVIGQGGVPRLLQLCRSLRPALRAHAAECLAQLCIAIDTQPALIGEGVIAEFVNLVKTGAPRAQAHAAAGIAQLSRGGVAALPSAAGSGHESRTAASSGGDGGSTRGDDGVDEGVRGDDDPGDGDRRLQVIEQEGAIPPLVALLSSPLDLAKEHAACALAHLAHGDAQRHTISRANGLVPLVALFNLPADQRRTFEHAAVALARLASLSGETQSVIAKRLVSLLGSEKTVVQARAARALRELTAKQPESAVIILNAGALLQLVRMMTSSATDVQEEASAALLSLACASHENQLTIATGLVATLRTANGTSQAQIIALLLKLCADTGIRAAIVKAGVLPLLMAQLRAPAVATLAVAVLGALVADEAHGAQYAAQLVGDADTEGVVRALVALLGPQVALDTQAHAVSVLNGLTAHLPSCRSHVRALGGLQRLVTGLANQQHQLTAKGAMAATVLNVARSGRPESQSAAAHAIGSLVSLLGDDLACAIPDGTTPDGGSLGVNSPSIIASTRMQAAAALAGIVESHAANQEAVRLAGGIEALVALLAPPSQGGCSDHLHVRASITAHPAPCSVSPSRGSSHARHLPPDSRLT